MTAKRYRKLRQWNKDDEEGTVGVLENFSQSTRESRKGSKSLGDIRRKHMKYSIYLLLIVVAFYIILLKFN